MEQAVQDLLKMGDVESLYEVMTEHDDFIYCLDAAEALVRLGDARGADFLISATESEDEDIRDVAQEILDSNEIVKKMKELEVAPEKVDNTAAIEAVKQRIAAGKKAFIYKTIYLPSNYFISSDPSDGGDYIEALNEFGFEGWEVAAFFPMSAAPGRSTSPVSLSGKLTGGHFLIKKEITPSDSAELDEL